MSRTAWTRACTTAVVASLLVLAAACGDNSPTPAASTTTTKPHPAVSFASPKDGATVANPVAVKFATSDFMVEPAGEVHPGAGHLHVMVDVPCVPVGQVIPKDAHHLHYGKGQTEAKIDLSAGKHTLCLQAGDGAHTALALTDTITITVGDQPSVAIVAPAADAAVTSPVTVEMAVYNFKIEPAGAVHAGAGHLHIMVDVPCVTPGQVIPKDAQHVHLGEGQTQTTLTLAPGPHTLCVQAGDGAHTALPITRQVTFTVS